jgi:hypothetical protein
LIVCNRTDGEEEWESQWRKRSRNTHQQSNEATYFKILRYCARLLTYQNIKIHKKLCSKHIILILSQPKHRTSTAGHQPLAKTHSSTTFHNRSRTESLLAWIGNTVLTPPGENSCNRHSVQLMTSRNSRYVRKSGVSSVHVIPASALINFSRNN